MNEEQTQFLKDEAAKFARIVHHGASKYDQIRTLKERVDQELKSYLAANRNSFLQFWLVELENHFHDHLKNCPKPEDCPQHKTFKNAKFIVSQYESIVSEFERNSLQTNEPFKDSNDLNFYFNATNIPNQDLVFETYNYFKKGTGKEIFDATDFLNILNWHYRFIASNIELPFVILDHLNNLSISALQRHVLIGFILKWFGGSPVNNLNTQYNTTLRLIETEYLEYKSLTIKKLQDVVNRSNLNGLSESEAGEVLELKTLNNILDELHNIIDNTESTIQLKAIETHVNRSLQLGTSSILSQSNPFKFFVSHSSKDEELVKLFVDKILQLALRIDHEKIFCTSIEACTITSGYDFRSFIKEQLIGAECIIQIITSNYRNSEVCLNEMGAAWVLGNKVVPFILHPVTYESVGFIHQPTQLLRLNDEDDLLKFIDEMKTLNRNLPHTEVKRHVDEFVNLIKDFKEDQ